MKLYIQNNVIIANSGTSPAIQAMKPWRHACGVHWWTCSNANGVYALESLTDLQQRTLAEIEATQEYIDWQAEQDLIQDATDAVASFQTLPTWLKTWDMAQAESYIDTNVTDLASAKVVLKEIGKAIILFRDFIKIRIS